MPSPPVAMLGGMKLNATFTKLAILAVITLLLCLVLSEIGGLVHERQARQREASQNIEQSLAGPQALAGPLLVRECRESWPVISAGKKETVETRDIRLVAPPHHLKVAGGLSPEVRYRGLFKVNTYLSELTLEASWDSTAELTPRAEHPNGRVGCSAPVVAVAVSDPRGLRAAELKRDGRVLAVQPGTTHPAYRGLHATLPDLRDGEPLALSLKLSVVGSRRLGIVPAGADTQVALQSSWPHPSFTGQFLPVERNVGASGFAARWQVSSLASTAASDLQAGGALPNLSDGTVPAVSAYDEAARAKANALEVLAVELIDPVNPYMMSHRAIKYGLMFIVLTFVTVGLTELLTGRRVHPVQYLLVGLALSLFFLLLLSLSEHLPFLVAYLVAAGAAAAVLTQYAAAMLGGWLRGLSFGGGITLLYGALYVLLSREQTALVIGALLLFAVLTTVMIVTRRMDWYGLGAARLGQAD